MIINDNENLEHCNKCIDDKQTYKNENCERKKFTKS